MSWGTVMRVAVGIAIGIGLAALPFVQYGARTHTHPAAHHQDQPHFH